MADANEVILPAGESPIACLPEDKEEVDWNPDSKPNVDELWAVWGLDLGNPREFDLMNGEIGGGGTLIIEGVWRPVWKDKLLPSSKFNIEKPILTQRNKLRNYCLVSMHHTIKLLHDSVK